MRKMLVSVLAGVAVCVLFAGVSHASVTIDFHEFDMSGTEYTYMSSYSNSGFTLTGDMGGSRQFASPQQSIGNGYYFGDANLLNLQNYSWTTLTSSGAFTINSIDVHALLTPGTGTPLDFYAYSGSTPVGHINYVIPDYEWHTVYFGSSFENITSLKWQQAEPSWHSFDDIVLNGNPAVPEPATMVLFGIGSAAMAFMRRKKNLA